MAASRAGMDEPCTLERSGHGVPGDAWQRRAHAGMRTSTGATIGSKTVGAGSSSK